MEYEFKREEILISKEKIEKLKKSKIIIYGIGGVGSYVVEGLARAGIENISLVDYDIIDITNINRQIHALHSTIGKKKIDVMKERILDINPNIKVEIFDSNLLENYKFKQNVQNTNLALKKEEDIIDNSYNYVVDAVDTVSTKIKIIEKAKELNVPVISAMGVGNKLDPFKFKIEDISKTKVCKLAKVVRKELKNRNIKNVKVLYSTEETQGTLNKNNVLGSISYMPSIAGLMIAAEVIKDLTN